MLTFEKTITRDWSLGYAQVALDVYVREFHHQFGWGYTDAAFEASGGALALYRSPSEHIDGMRHFILTHLRNDERWMDAQSEEVLTQVRLFREWRAVLARQKLPPLSDDALQTLVREYATLVTRLTPRYLMMLWFPIQMENHPDALRFASAIKRAGETRTQIEKSGAEADDDARTLAAETLRRKGQNVALAKYATIDELDALLSGRADALTDAELRRRQATPFLFTRRGIQYVSIREYLRAQGYELKTTPTDTGTKSTSGSFELRGTPAQAGHATGHVRIVRSREDFHAFQKGEVLVAAMTTPDFLPVIKKASAIVTDEGGVTCHAAIAAREFGIPCIVGTRTATQTLTNGEHVNVDATNGSVHKTKQTR